MLIHRSPMETRPQGSVWLYSVLFAFLSNNVFSQSINQTVHTHCSQPWRSRPPRRDSPCPRHTSSAGGHTCESRDTGRPRGCTSWTLWRHITTEWVELMAWDHKAPGGIIGDLLKYIYSSTILLSISSFHYFYFTYISETNIVLLHNNYLKKLLLVTL